MLLLQGGEVGADGAEGLCAFSGAEASGDLVLDLGHADRLFGKVVTERNAWIGREAQDIVGMITQSSVEIERYALRRAPASAAGGFLWIGSGRFSKDRLVVGADRLDAQSRQRLAMGGHRFMVGTDQQIDHALGPRLSAFLMDEGQFTQMMGVAQRMGAGQFPIRGPAVMNQRSLEPIQQTEVLKRRLAALGMQTQPGQGVGHRGVQPVELARHPQTGLVGARDIRLGHRIRDPRDRGGQPLTRLADHGLNRAGRDRHTIQVSKDVGSARHGQHVVLRQIDRQRLNAGAILNRGSDLGREFAAVQFAAGAAQRVNPVLGHCHCHRRQIEDLADFGRRLPREQFAADVAYLGQWMIHHVIGMRHLLERRTGMTRLTARRSASLLAHRLRLLQAFGRGWNARIPAVLCQLPAQMGDFPLQPGHFRCQPDDFLAQPRDQFPQRMNERVFLRVRQASQVGQFLHAAYCRLVYPALKPRSDALLSGT